MRLEAVGKRYGPRQPWVVRGVSADVPDGRLIRVAGRNGSGKSTRLRVVAGVSLPSEGKVTGRPHCGYAPERFPGGLPFPGRGYLRHLARIHGLRGAAGPRRVEEWLERLGQLAVGLPAVALQPPQDRLVHRVHHVLPLSRCPRCRIPCADMTPDRASSRRYFGWPPGCYAASLGQSTSAPRRN